MSSGKNYYGKYKYYKRIYTSLLLELREKQAIMDSCRVLLARGLQTSDASGPFVPASSSIASTSTPKPEVSRKLSFAGNDSDKISENGELGAKKLKLSDGAPSDSLQSDNLSKPIDPDETFYDLKEEANTPERSHNSTQRAEGPIQRASFRKLREALSPLGHVCPTPRCPQHQPFFVSNKKELAKLSPRTRQMGTTRRGKSPKKFYDLDMPSTQVIRTRNQSQE